MCKGKENICRLCLKTLYDDYNVVEEITKEIFEVLLIKLDLSITEQPVVCTSCLESIREAFSFKSTCFAVDELVVSLAIDRESPELDIRDVYLIETEKKSFVFNESYTVCRFCLQCLKKRSVNFLNDLRQESADDMLLKCVPELDLDTIKEPVICKACTKSLESYYSFALKCQNTEEIIMKYCEIQGVENKGHINLSNVLKFLNSGMPECIDGCTKAISLKEDSLSQNEEDKYSNIKDTGIKIEEEELIIKEENIYGD